MDSHRWPHWSKPCKICERAATNVPLRPTHSRVHQIESGSQHPSPNGNGGGLLPTPYYAYRFSHPPPYPLFPPPPLPGGSPGIGWTPRRQLSGGRPATNRRRSSEQPSAGETRRSNRTLARRHPSLLADSDADADDECGVDDDDTMKPTVRSSSAGNEKGASASSTARKTNNVDRDGGGRGRSGSSIDKLERSQSSEPSVTTTPETDTKVSKRVSATSGSAAANPSRRSKINKGEPVQDAVKTPKTPVVPKLKGTPGRKRKVMVVKGDKKEAVKTLASAAQVAKQNTKLKKMPGRPKVKVVEETDLKVEEVSTEPVALAVLPVKEKESENSGTKVAKKRGRKPKSAIPSNSFLGSVLKTDLGEILRRSCRERKSNSRFNDDGMVVAAPVTTSTPKSTPPPAAAVELPERPASVRLRFKREMVKPTGSAKSRRGAIKKNNVAATSSQMQPDLKTKWESPIETFESSPSLSPPTTIHVTVSNDTDAKKPRKARKSIGNSPSKSVTPDAEPPPYQRIERTRKSWPRQLHTDELVATLSTPSTSSQNDSGNSLKMTLITRPPNQAELTDRLDSSLGSDSTFEGGFKHQRPKRRHFKGGTYQLSLKRSAKKKRPGMHGSVGLSRGRGELTTSSQEDVESISTEASNLAETDADELTADEQSAAKSNSVEAECEKNQVPADDGVHDGPTATVSNDVGTAIVHLPRSYSPQEVPSYSPGIPEAAKGQDVPRSSAAAAAAARMNRLLRPAVLPAREVEATPISPARRKSDSIQVDLLDGVVEPPVAPDVGLLTEDNHQGTTAEDLFELQSSSSSTKENGLWRGTKRKTVEEDDLSSTISSASSASLTSKNTRDRPKTKSSNQWGSPAKSPQPGTEIRRITSITVPQDETNCGLLMCTCRTTYGIHLTRDRTGSTCQGIDCIDKRLIGCVNMVTTPEVYRSSVRIPFLALCEVHRQRLRLHQCCPGCGLFCTQGSFVQCRADPKKATIHHAHPECMSMRDGKRACPHCSSTVALLEVTLELNSPRSPTLLSSHPRKRKEPGARMAFTRGNENVISPDPSKLVPAVSCTISDNGKEISSAGLPIGPDRSQLETLLVNNSHTEKLGQLGATGSSSQRFPTKSMQLATKAGDMEKVLQMLMSGFDPNTKFEDQDNCSIVHIAAAQGNLVLVHLLVQAGACLDSMDNNLQTPIMLSIENNFSLVSLYLIKAGVQLDARGEDGMTALHLAAKAGQLDVCRTILDTGKVTANILDDGGWTAMVWAAEYRHLDVVKFLLERGCDPNLRDNEHNIALHWSAFSGSLEICEIFLNQGCNLNSTNEHGDTPLHIAARQDKYDCVMLFLARNADVDVLNKEVETPLMCCPDVQSQTWLALSMTKHLKKISASRTTRSERIVHQDISRGKEQNPIQCVNCFDDESAPADFMYIRENCETSPINMDRSIASLQCCQCEDDCSSPNCTCGSLSLKCWYDKEGKLIEEFNLLDPPMIFECNRACRCYTSCNNRTVQHGITCRLQLFRTKVKGWGVRALREIPKGTFICEYVGELISDLQADQRQDDSYLFDLDNRDGETYCIDARHYGNISRFINHLCEPNLVPVKIFIDYQDLRFPRIALFSSRTIRANEELGFDYGDKFWIIKCKDFTCACLAEKCKYSDATITETLANYHAISRPADVVDVTVSQNQ